MARRSISGGRAISPVYLELYAEERLRKIAIAQQIVLAATEVPGVAERERQEAFVARLDIGDDRSEEHTSELQSLMRISYAVFCLKKKNKQQNSNEHHATTDEQ